MEETQEFKSMPRKGFLKRIRKFVVVLLLISILSGSTMTVQPKKSEAFVCFCIGAFCFIDDLMISAIIWTLLKAVWTPIILENIEDHLNSEENWIVEDFFADHFLRGLREMTTYLSSFGMYQVEILGTFLDAKQQLETQRLFWQMHAEAHKDYHPSDDFCWFGTNARSMAATEDRANYNRVVMARRSMARQLGNVNANAARGVSNDMEGRWRQFVTTYCDTKDNNWRGAIVASGASGLELACDHDGPGPGTAKGATNPERANRDIDYTRLIEAPRTLDVNFDAAVPPPPVVLPTDDEEDVLAMASNLYGHRVLTQIPDQSLKNNPALQNYYMALRSIAAKRSVAENSYNAIVALKSAGTGNSASQGGAPAGCPPACPQQVRQYMARVMRDLMPASVPDNEIYEMIGENPSLYSQLEILAKRIYQNPKFYANLYDTPANIQRKAVAMKGIEMMLDRALFESELRQEMLMSILLTGEMRQRYRKTSSDLQRIYE